MSCVSTAKTDPSAASICAGEYHGASKVRAETAINDSRSLTSSRHAGRGANVILTLVRSRHASVAADRSPGGGRAAMRKQVHAQVPRQTASALRHDLIVVPAEGRLQQWRDNVHPRLGGDYGPVVAHVGGAGLGREMPAPGAAEISVRDAFQRRRALNSRHPHGKRSEE